jgi:hypothetical protein
VTFVIRWCVRNLRTNRPTAKGYTVGRHRRRPHRAAGIRAVLRRIAHPEDPPTQHADVQLSLLTDTSPLRVPEHLTTPPPPAPPAPRHQRPEPPNPPARPDLVVVRDDDGGPATVNVPTGEDVVLCYPDGRRIPVDWHADAAGASRRRYVADVPAAATLDTGMVIQAGPLMVPVRLLDDPPRQPAPTWDDWYVGGGRP